MTTTRIDAVLSWHMDPQTCGVAKFNHALAARLRLPCLPLMRCMGVSHPLVSVKPAECDGAWADHVRWYPAFSLFLHGGIALDRELVPKAARVYAASSEIAKSVRRIRPDVIEAFCPSTIDGNPSRGTYRVLTFGMAHKLALDHYRALKEQLDVEHPDYTVSLSTAVHEGSPWDGALAESVAAMRAIFGDKLRVLGYLADDALAKELQECDAVAVYFDPAVRENNTTYWAAAQAGKTIYTNRDAFSPPLDPERYSWAALEELLK